MIRPSPIRYAPAAMVDPNAASSPRVFARARRAGVVVRSADLSAVLGLLVLWGGLQLWGGAVWSAFLRAVRTGLSAAADPAAARLALSAGLGELAPALLGLSGALVLAGLSSLMLQIVSAGRSGIAARRRPAWGIAGFASEPARIEGLWSLIKAVMLGLVIAGVLLDAMPAIAGMLVATPPELAHLYGEIVDVWLARVLLLAVPIVVLDVVVQRFRVRLSLKQDWRALRDQQRREEADPHVRAQLRRAAHGRASERQRGERTTGESPIRDIPENSGTPPDSSSEAPRAPGEHR